MIDEDRVEVAGFVPVALETVFVDGAGGAVDEQVGVVVHALRKAWVVYRLVASS